MVIFCLLDKWLGIALFNMSSWSIVQSKSIHKRLVRLVVEGCAVALLIPAGDGLGFLSGYHSLTLLV